MKRAQIIFSDSKILGNGYDGVFISNGPGDPEPTKAAISLVRTLFGKIPIFGICLGHQILCLAMGGMTYKLKFGHHGVNHPVLNIKSGRVHISSQNHGFAVDPSTLDRSGFEITHINLNDNTVSGIWHENGLATSLQFHAEASPGSHDSSSFFNEFVETMSKFKQKMGVN